MCTGGKLNKGGATLFKVVVCAKFFHRWAPPKKKIQHTISEVQVGELCQHFFLMQMQLSHYADGINCDSDVSGTLCTFHSFHLINIKIIIMLLISY